MRFPERSASSFLLFRFSAAWAQTDDVPLKLSRLDLSDDQKLKSVLVKSYDGGQGKACHMHIDCPDARVAFFPMSPQNPEFARWFPEEAQPHARELRSYLRTQFPRLRDIDDIVQGTHARLVRTRRMSKIAKARAYLFATARNAALDPCRRNQIVERAYVIEDDPYSVCRIAGTGTSRRNWTPLRKCELAGGPREPVSCSNFSIRRFPLE